jgi:hypothetical protein
VTWNPTFPFLSIELEGMNWLPVTFTDAGFCPRAWNVFVPGFPHVAVGFALAESTTAMSPLPSPLRVPSAVRVRPLSVNEGLACEAPFRCTLDARAT